MTYELQNQETLAQGMRRIICREIENAIKASRRGRNGNRSPVHEARKHLKKARAALAMISKAIPRPDRRREQRCLRTVARLISEVRDAEVRLETLKELREMSPGRRSRYFEETEKLLAFELESFLAAFSGWQEEARSKLSCARRRAAKWPLEQLSWKSIRKATQCSYKQGRDALHCALKKPTSENFHSLRKAVKRLSYQLRILRPLEREIFDSLETQLKTIGQHLGRAHDLAFLAQRLEWAGGGVRRRRGGRTLAELIESRQSDAQRTAVVFGERFYAECPRDFGRKVGQYFVEWERERARNSSVGFFLRPPDSPQLSHKRNSRPFDPVKGRTQTSKEQTRGHNP